ncbi:MAG: hypothetical protein IJQ80_08970 [Clostridia bacterium]|nr:hypothetical protein [Clostridia bacterium]MBR0303969.1 hypothetical protein [Clostridia bacterium]
MSNFDVANLALQVACGASNELKYDDKNMPSVMVKIPKFTWADVGIGTSTDVFPAFKINGHEVDAIYFSKYMNIVQNSRAYSLPGQDYANNINLDNSIARCTAKGEGWHLTTRLEWMAVALWCLKNGTLPKGNNNYGKDHSETVYQAIPMTKDGEGKTLHVAGGTGPLTWSHNGQQDGIWDLNGNGYEWVGGVRTVYGELQVLSSNGAFENSAADPDNSQGASSALWYAIDGTTGELITPNGSGTTQNSLKIDKISNKLTWVTGAISMATPGQIYATLESVELDASVCDAAKHILQALGFYRPDDITAGALGGDYVYFDNSAAERSFHCGGYYYYSSAAGVFYALGYYSRSSTYTYISFRAAYCDLPTA